MRASLANPRRTIPMTQVLLVRVSSLGDVVQTFPAVTDLARQVEQLHLDWVVEDAYIELVSMHSAVARPVPFGLRGWRKRGALGEAWKGMRTLRGMLRQRRYDSVIESQGLLKSLVIAKMARGPIYGFGPKTVREPFVSRFYDHTFEFPPDVHRIWHYRGLAAKAFGYELDDVIDYGLTKPARPAWLAESDYVVLLHSTARSEKLWSEASWIEVGRWLASRGVACVLPWGNPDEHARAERLASLIPDAQVAPQLRVDEAGALLAHARAVIGVDTGLMHLAVAFEVPVVGIYLATRPLHHGPLGRGPTAFRGGMGDTPTPAQVLDALGEVAPDLA